jgi:hypothetical protein
MKPERVTPRARSLSSSAWRSGGRLTNERWYGGFRLFIAWFLLLFVVS